MIATSLLIELFNTNCIQRWNDKLRPVDLVELDYQAHRMMYAYFLGKFEEGKAGFRWRDVIEGGVFDLLETSVLTDLKWNVKERLNRDPKRRKETQQYVSQQLESRLGQVSSDLMIRFGRHQKGNGSSGLVRSLLRSASDHARLWEFCLLAQANPSGYEIKDIKMGLEANEGKHNLKGCTQLHKRRKYQNFLHLCGELRFQRRWSHLYLSPRTSVLGHSMFVATVSYLLSLEAGACEQQSVNNFFHGLFHDLAETQTRDVRGPLKKDVPVLGEVLMEISREMMEREVLRLLPPSWHGDFKVFALAEPLDEANYATVNGVRQKVKLEEVLGKFNKDEYAPICGYLVKAADNLGAFLETVEAVRNGCGSPEVQAARYAIPKAYNNVHHGGLDLGLLYREMST
jgi:putative hydrolase of HD superfamily